MLRWLLLSVVVVGTDQLTKFLALKYLVRHSPVEVLPFLNFTLTFNTGAAFGFLNNAPGWQNIFFIAVATLASTLIFFMLKNATVHERFLKVGLALILGGAVGNVIDRLLYGHVIDFIDVVFGSWHFWTFNVADSAISIGAVFLIWDAFFVKKSS
jgi:signal peptidase II